MAELGTFGAVMGFAIDLERTAVAYYQALAADERQSVSPDTVQSLIRAHRKRQQVSEQMRREYVTEMILEPIHGLERGRWEITVGQGVDEAVRLERHISGFCLAAAEKVSIPQVARQFRRLATESAALEEQARLLG